MSLLEKSETVSTLEAILENGEYQPTAYLPSLWVCARKNLDPIACMSTYNAILKRDNALFMSSLIFMALVVAFGLVLTIAFRHAAPLGVGAIVGVIAVVSVTLYLFSEKHRTKVNEAEYTVSSFVVWLERLSTNLGSGTEPERLQELMTSDTSRLTQRAIVSIQEAVDEASRSENAVRQLKLSDVDLGQLECMVERANNYKRTARAVFSYFVDLGLVENNFNSFWQSAKDRAASKSPAT